MTMDVEVSNIYKSLDPDSLAHWLAMGRSMARSMPRTEPVPVRGLRLVHSLSVRPLQRGIDSSLESTERDLIRQPISGK